MWIYTRKTGIQPIKIMDLSEKTGMQPSKMWGVAKPKKNCINETQQKEGERAKEPLKTGKLLIRSLNYANKWAWF